MKSESPDGGQLLLPMAQLRKVTRPKQTMTAPVRKGRKACQFQRYYSPNPAIKYRRGGEDKIRRTLGL